MKKLITGLHKFQTEIFPGKKILFEDLVKEQTPEVLFITCSDSRINPNLITSTEPGDLFIIRNAGNIIPTYKFTGGEWATIEFAILVLNIKHIVVCGHSHCGIIQASINKANNKDNLNSMPSLSKWINENIEPTLNFVKKNYQNLDETSVIDILTQENVLNQIENLKTHPDINLKLIQGELIIHAWVFKFSI